MKNFAAALFVEFLKVRRSKVPLLTALGFALAPIMGGLFMIILKDPEFARQIGLLRTKAQLIAGTADWPTYFSLLSQATAVGGLLLFALITSWVFGCEFSDRTAKDFLALPTPRRTIVMAKFFVVLLWSLSLILMIYILGLLIGHVVTLPLWSTTTLVQGTYTLLITALLTIALTTPVAFVASYGRGYLAPMGFAILTLVLAQVLGAAGWGPLFPWSVGALYAGLADAGSSGVEAISFVLVGATSLIGLVATDAWWHFADHTQ